MDRRDTLTASLLAAGLMACLLPFAHQGVDLHHDGIMLKPALDVLSGQVLFRDTFMQYGALTCYMQVCALWIQPSLLALRLLTVAAYGASLFFLYAAWRVILPRSLTIIACGVFALLIPAYEKNWLDDYWMLLSWSSVYAVLFQSIGLYALFQVIRGLQPERWGLVLGMTTAAIFWCRQPVGIVLMGCLLVVGLALHWTNWERANPARRRILWNVAGGLGLVMVLPLGGIMLTGAGPEWWYQNFVWPRKWVTGSVNVNWRDFIVVFVHPGEGAALLVLLLAALLPGRARKIWPTLSPRWIIGWYLCLALALAWKSQWTLHVLGLREGGWTVLIPIIVLAQAGFSILEALQARAQAKSAEFYLVAALSALSLGSLLQYYPVPDSWHILWSLAPAFGLFVFVFWRWSGWPASVMTAVMVLAFLPAVYMKAHSARRSLARPLVELEKPAVLRGIRVLPEQARRLGQLSDLLDRIAHHDPTIPSALIGNDAMYLCFMSNRVNPSPYFVTWAGLTDPSLEEIRWKNIRRLRPLIYFHKANWEEVGQFYRGSRYVPLLYLPDEALEIAVPQELADAMGLGAYGVAKKP